MNEIELTTEEQVEINYILAKSYRKTTRNNLKDLVRLIDTAIKQNNLANTNYRTALIRRCKYGIELTTEEQVEINYILAKSYRKTTRNNLKDLVRLIDTAIKQNNLANVNYRKALIRRCKYGHEKRNVVTTWIKSLDMRCIWWHIKCRIYKSLYSKKVTDSETWESRDQNPIQWH